MDIAIVLIFHFVICLQIKDEHERHPIKYIRITHVADGELSDAKLIWGGPGKKFAGIRVVSPPGRNINSVVQIYG